MYNKEREKDSVLLLLTLFFSDEALEIVVTLATVCFSQ